MDRNLILYVASYGTDAAAAAEDFQSLRQLPESMVVAAVVLQRDPSGEVAVKEHGGGLVAGGTTLGAVAGFVVGLFAPPLLAATAVGAGIGAAAGAIAKHHEEHELGVEAEQWLPNDSSAIVAVVDDLYLDNIDRAVAKATKKLNKAIDKGDYDAVVKALDEGSHQIVDAVDS